MRRDTATAVPLLERCGYSSPLRSTVPLEVLNGDERIAVVAAEAQTRQSPLAGETVDPGGRHLPPLSQVVGREQTAVGLLRCVAICS
jgi:hypothetical protein